MEIYMHIYIYMHTHISNNFLKKATNMKDNRACVGTWKVLEGGNEWSMQL